MIAKLLRLHYLDAMSEGLHIDEQQRVSDELARLDAEQLTIEAPDTTEQDFEKLLANITSVNIGADDRSVKLLGSPPVRIHDREVGLKDSDPVGAGGAFAVFTPERTRSNWINLIAV